MSEPYQSILVFLGGATGTEIVRYLLTFRREKRKDAQAADDLEFKQITDLNRQAAELREEMRRNNAELRAELAGVRVEVETWRRSYFDLFHTAREIQHQYGLVTTYLNAILAWLKQQDIAIPMPVPVLPDLPPLPGPPTPGHRSNGTTPAPGTTKTAGD